MCFVSYGLGFLMRSLLRWGRFPICVWGAWGISDNMFSGFTFTHGGKSITTKFLGEYISITGGGKDKRPIVELEFEFAGTNYGKVKFGLDNRDELNSDVLLNRKTMKMLNVMVSPQRKYVVTTKFSVDK